MDPQTQIENIEYFFNSLASLGPLGILAAVYVACAVIAAVICLDRDDEFIVKLIIIFIGNMLFVPYQMVNRYLEYKDAQSD